MGLDWDEEEYIAKKAEEDEAARQRAAEEAERLADEEAAKQKSAEELYETLDRINKSINSYVAYFITVNNLAPQNKKPAQINLILKMLERIDPDNSDYVFRFANHTFVLLIEQSKKALAEQAFAKIKALFPRDAAVQPHSAVPLIKIFYLTTEAKVFRAELAAMLKDVTGNTESNIFDRDESTVPLCEANLYAVLDVLDTVRTGETIRRQPIVAVVEGSQTGIFFHEFFVSDIALSKKMIPNVDLTANDWLRKYLGETLDLKAMDALQSTHNPFVPSMLSLNLNLATFSLNAFDIFNFAIKNKGLTFIAEIQPWDLFLSPHKYNEVKTFLHQNGHKLLLDTVTPETLDFLDIAKLAPDYVKVMYSDKFKEESYTILLDNLIEQLGGASVILGECNSQEALNFGAAHKIHFFQGTFMDNIVCSTITTACVLSRCTVAECMSRYGVFSGTLRDRCPYPDVMNDPPVWISRF